MVKHFVKSSLLVALALLLFAMPLSSAKAIDSIDMTEEVKLIKARATDAGELLMAHYYHTGYIDKYPDYYAGCYIGDDNLLHIRVCYSSKNVVPEILELLHEYQDVIVIEYGEYSRNELLEYADSLANELMDKGIAVTSWGVDEITSKVQIGVLDTEVMSTQVLLNENELSSLQPAIAEIEIKAQDYLELESLTNGDPGSLINGSYSLGVYGYYNGQRAFVTCAHGGAVVGGTATIGSYATGRYTYVQCAHDEIGDYAIGLLNGSVTMKHIFGSNDDYVIMGMAYSPLVGSDLYKYGGMSDSYASGEVIIRDTTFPVNYLGNSITVKGISGMEIVSGSTTGGDSGGPYVTYDYRFCGTHEGKLTDGTRTIVYFTPGKYIYRSGFTPLVDHTTNWVAKDENYHHGTCPSCLKYSEEEHAPYWDETTIPHCTRCGFLG